MKRKIKFRGKRLDNGEWVYGDLLNPITSCRIINYTESDGDEVVCAEYHYHDVVPDTVGQFTGLYDMAGKEIYDGDILYCKCKDIIVGYLEVFWQEEQAAFLVEDYDGQMNTTGNLGLLSEFDTSRCCVICGNTHDNPDMLEKA